MDVCKTDPDIRWFIIVSLYPDSGYNYSILRRSDIETSPVSPNDPLHVLSGFC